ncbi:type II toxin-antitoxin system RelE/ParE family toxin [Aureimonas sp. Leaf460]|uniref:type II toxin-antitoxin system RelE/ParE family toxin n=1 Tax=unclassified Aureimonas TaxID=2615206 RepID=UPI0006FC02D1|nr:hypothetical protein ASG62_05365 [Aureimonas sp. Leaf427]KQT81587.1 hypothetical protein ASG54_02645 [Aureimonas sp. Leaf460]
MRVVLLDTARTDLIWFRRYYRRVFPEGGREGVRRFNRMLKALALMPELGRVVVADNREVQISRTPFSIVYRVRSDRIEVLRVWDQRADRREDGGSG